MKILHYNLYENGKIGMCNLLMSIENALLIAKLTKREKIVFYGNENLFNANKKIDELFDINFNVEFSRENTKSSFLNTIDFEYNLHECCLYYKKFPTRSFLNGRDLTIDLSIYENQKEISTKDDRTLSFYSYLFYLEDDRVELYDWLKNTLKPKSKYFLEADRISSIFKNYNSLHIRRGDYLLTQSFNKNFDIKFCLDKILNNFLKEDTLFIHTDELDKNYFNELTKYYSDLVFIEDLIDKNNFDVAERGLISLIIASNSKLFVGTMKSTFTSFIQRYRLYNGLDEDFRFLYVQDMNIKLDVYGRYLREAFSEYSWNHSYLQGDIKWINFWYREWESCYPQKNKNTDIRVFPKFLHTEFCNYIIQKSDEQIVENNKIGSEYYEREKRNRANLSSNDPIIKEIILNACFAIKYDISEHELSQCYIQVFKQYSEGETFWHMDSLAPVNLECRKRSVLFYLNSDFTGSEISFPYANIKLSPKAGTMITYPLVNEFDEMNRLTSHSASIITSGVKYMCYFDLKNV